MAKEPDCLEQSALDYIIGVKSGKIPAGKLVKLAVRRHVQDLAKTRNQKRPRFYFDEDAGRQALRFFKFLRHYHGEWAGKPFVLSPWQAWILWSLFGWKRADGTRKYRLAYLEMGRKNGKSSFAAAIGLLLLTEGEPSADIFAAATKREQAKLVHDSAVRMVEASPALSSALEHFKTTGLSYKDPEGFLSRFTVVSAEARTMDGLNPHGAIIDELHEHPTRDIFDRLVTGTTSRRQPLIVCITTAGVNQTGICFELHEKSRRVLTGQNKDSTFFPFVCSPDPKDKWDTEKSWAKANPNLGVSVRIETLRQEAHSAKISPSAQNSFLRFHCNTWVRQVTRFLDLDKWDACAGKMDAHELAEACMGRPCFVGLDLSFNTDFTCAVLAFPSDNPDESTALVPFHWVPKNQVEALEDKTQMPLQSWIHEGFVEAIPGDTIDHEYIKTRLLQIHEAYPITMIAYDRWSAANLVTALEAEHLSVAMMGQGYFSMSEPTKNFLGAVLGQKIHHGGHPVLRWQADCLEVEADAAGNIKPSKPRVQTSRSRIDGMVAAIMALARVTAEAALPPQDSVYDAGGRGWGSDKGILSL